MGMAQTGKFLKKEEDSLIFNIDGGELVYYIPESYFRSDGSMKFAEMAGEYINTIGVFPYEVFDSKGKSIYGVKLMNHPMVISCMPDEIDKVKGLVIDKKIDVPVDYRVLRFRKGATALVSLKSPQNAENIENLFRIFMITGNIPNLIPYDEIHTFFTNAVKLNGASFGISNQLLGVMVSQICRSMKDEAIPFRLAKENDMHKFKSISIKMVPKYISAFTAITSENWDDAVVNAAINKNKVDSPMEPILMD